MSAGGANDTTIGRQVWLALGAMALAIFVIANDITAMSVAIPSIEADFNADVGTAQWVVNAYSLIFGVFIVTGGRLADMFGRRRTLFIGAAIFVAFSTVGAAAPGIGVLIAARAAMGIGGALMWPAILGLVYAVLPERKAGFAGGLVIGVAGLGNAAGPLLGGALAGSVGWRWILILNIPIAGIATFVTWRLVHVAQDTDRARMDYLGIATLSIALVALLVALGQGPSVGWSDPVVVAGFVLCPVLLIAFWLAERRAGDRALVPPDIMRNRNFIGACVATMLMSFTFFSALLYLPQYLQKILGFTSFASGAGLLPLMGVFAVVSFAAGPLYERLGAKVVVVTGAAAMALGGALASIVDASSGYVVLIPAMVVLGLGVGLFYSAITTAGVTALDASRSSLAGGVLYMFQIAGGAIGLGLTTTVFLTASNNAIRDDAAAAGVTLTAAESQSLSGVLAGTDDAAQLASGHAAPLGDELVHIAREAFTTGLDWALRFDSLMAVFGLIVAIVLVKGTRRAEVSSAPGTTGVDSPTDGPAPDAAS